MESTIIDVIKLDPFQKHPTILNSFEKIELGGSIIIKNDHDPKPLQCHLKDVYGDTFAWDYLVDGPTEWQVKITKNIHGEAEKTVGQMVKEDYRIAEIFMKYGVDFCCKGKQSLQKACADKGLDANLIKSEIEKLGAPTSLIGPEQLAPEKLADYVLHKHHTYVAESIPILITCLDKVASAHGAQHPEVLEVRALALEVFEELESHMYKEETILFPFIKDMAEAQSKYLHLSPPPFGSITNPINMMEAEHSAAGSITEKLVEITNNFTPPNGACNTFEFTYKKLDEFIKDLYQHIHLENNVLFPAAIALEKVVVK